MNVLELTGAIWLGALAAGFLGSLTGLGGGVVIVPLLTLGFGVDIRYAIGASLVSVIATSSGAAIAYVREGYTNIRVGMLLEIATTLGASLGALLATIVAPKVIAVIFGVVLVSSVYHSSHERTGHVGDGEPDLLSVRLRLDGTYPGSEGVRSYHVRRVPLGFGLMAVAGALSGLLGIGSGAMKVLAMDQAMCIPFRVSTTTSNFMIGVTAAASSSIYLHRGYVDVRIAAPVMLGALLGSTVGARLLTRLGSKTLRLIFAAVILILGLTMIGKGLGL